MPTRPPEKSRDAQTMAGKKVANGWPYCIVCFRKPIFSKLTGKGEIGFVAKLRLNRSNQFIARSLSCPDDQAKPHLVCFPIDIPHPAHLDGFLLVIVLVDTDRIDPK